MKPEQGKAYMNNLKSECLGAFATAQTAEQYEEAKCMAARLPVKTQYEVIDNVIAARRRLEAVGVL